MDQTLREGYFIDVPSCTVDLVQHLYDSEHHMLETRPPFNPRKRRTSDWVSSQRENSVQNPFKRQRCDSGRDSFPSEFWDNLSEVHLTRRALKELDHRNTACVADVLSLHPHPHWLITRSIVRLNKDSQPSLSADEYLYKCSTSVVKNLKRISRQGGPDMSELRGVSRISIYERHC